MQIYHGVIEDFNDPLKLGRVRVRIFGLHTDDMSLIPTESLPWAAVIQGVGTTSISPLLPGSWVAVYFQDPDNQYPVVLGILYGIPSNNSGQVSADEEQYFEYSDNQATISQNVVKDGSGAPVKDSSGEPIKTVPPTPPAVSPINGKVDPSKLGTVSAKEESNGNPATINNYSNGKDRGGASYGAYQFASYLKAKDTPTRDNITLAQTKSSPVLLFIRSAGLSQFDGLSPATPEFDAAWKTWANSDREKSFAIQHKYIEQAYYAKAITRLPQSITNRGLAIHEMIWSMSVQLDSSGAVSKIKSVAGNYDSSVCDSKIIADVYNSRIQTVQKDFSSSPQFWPGLIDRFNRERDALIKMAKTYEGSECGGTSTATPPLETTVKDKVVYTDTNKEIVKETVVSRKQSNTTKGVRGFRDISGKYNNSPNEPDTNRLARGVITGTIVETKRREVLSGKEAGDRTISEPTTQYNTLYPHNKVFATESGHIVEFDDTPGYERVNIHHKSGTFIEIHPDGKMVSKVKGENSLVITDDNNTIVIGSNNTSIEGNRNETIKGMYRLVVYGDVLSTVYGNVDINVDGNTKLKSTRIDLNPNE